MFQNIVLLTIQIRFAYSFRNKCTIQLHELYSRLGHISSIFPDKYINA